MKKLLFILVGIFALNSCNRDDSSSNTVSSILPKKLVSNGESATLSYNGNKIVSIKYQTGESVNFTYSGDLITKALSKDASGNNGDYTDYTYDASGNLLQSITTEPSSGSTYITTSKYSKLSDGRIQKLVTSSTVSGNQTTINSQSTNYYTISNGNIVKKEQIYYYTGGSSTTTITYVFDDKNSPFKNIVGFEKIYDDEMLFNRNNNLSSTITSISQFGSSSTTNISSERNAITYNNNGYPTKIDSYSKSGTSPESLDGSLSFEY